MMNLCLTQTRREEVRQNKDQGIEKDISEINEVARRHAEKTDTDRETDPEEEIHDRTDRKEILY